MTDRDIMQQALDALKQSSTNAPFDAHGVVYVEGVKIHKAAIAALNERLAQPEQEPVAYLCENAVGHKYFRWKKPSSTYKPIALYTTPPQPKPLTDEWIHRTTVLLGFNPEWTTEIGIAHAIVRAAEAAHGVKGDR